MELLQKYIFIPLDIFQKNMHNKHITNELDAWLMFFSTDDIQDMIWLITDYPECKPLYNTIYNICRNMEDVMGIFSEELRILDRNSLLFLPEYMQGEIDQLTDDLEQVTKEKEHLTESNQQLQTQLQNEQCQKIKQIKNMAHENFSEEKCARLLLIDSNIVRMVYQRIKDNPTISEDELCQLLEVTI